MSTTDLVVPTPGDAASAPDPSEALAGRLFDATIGTLELYAIHVGRRLGLYELLSDGRARTSDELAREAGVAERYAREWLEQQAVAGLLETETTQDPRRYRLDGTHARVLAHVEDPLHLAPFAAMVAGIGQALPHVVAAYRTGAGVPYAAYGQDFREGQGAANRPAFTHDLVHDWLPATGAVHARLRNGARVADVGCGLGWSTVAIAAAYPTCRVVGIDADAASVSEARSTLPSDLRDRVRYVEGDVRRIDGFGEFDVVVVLEALHDFGDPVAALSGVRAALADDGIVFVADERVAERFTAPGDEIERLMYGWSVVHCLPAAIDDGGHGATGTVLRPNSVADLARRAGFTSCEILPIDNEIFRFYTLTT
jgi:SAM-dependent methyltransferase